MVTQDPPNLALLTSTTTGDLKEIKRLLKSGIDVNELTITETSVSFKAETDGFEEATRIESALQRNPRFRDAQKGDEKKYKDGIKFMVTIPLAEADGETSEG